MLQNLLHRSRQLRKDEGGFTLIELLIVILILGVLAGIVVFSVRGISNHGDSAACKTEFRTVDTAIEAYYAQNTAYPTALQDLVDGGFLHSVPNKYVTGLTPAVAGPPAVPAKASGVTCP